MLPDSVYPRSRGQMVDEGQAQAGGSSQQKVTNVEPETESPEVCILDTEEARIACIAFKMR